MDHDLPVKNRQPGVTVRPAWPSSERAGVGTRLSPALRAAGVEVEGPLGRGETPPPAAAVILCVPDGEIGAARLPPGRCGAAGRDTRAGPRR